MIRVVDLECGCEGVIDCPAEDMRELMDEPRLELHCPTHGQTARRVTATVRPWRGVAKKDRWADIVGQ